MRVFKNAWFERFARKQRIPDEALLEAVARAERGQIDADLGGGVIKQRVARRGQGRSGDICIITHHHFVPHGYPGLLCVRFCQE